MKTVPMPHAEHTGSRFNVRLRKDHLLQIVSTLVRDLQSGGQANTAIAAYLCGLLVESSLRAALISAWPGLGAFIVPVKSASTTWDNSLTRAPASQ
jgi:hypothetical protein